MDINEGGNLNTRQCFDTSESSWHFCLWTGCSLSNCHLYRLL